MRGLGVRHLDRRRGPLTLHEQDGERPAPPAEPRHHVAERFVGERVVPERGADDRRRIDPDHVEALPARQERTGVLQAGGSGDRQREVPRWWGVVVHPDLDVAPDEDAGFRVDRGSERADHRLRVHENPETERRGRDEENGEPRESGHPMDGEVRDRRVATELRSRPTERLDGEPGAERREPRDEQDREREQERARPRDVQSRVLDERASCVKPGEHPERPRDREHLPGHPREPALERMHLEGPEERHARRRRRGRTGRRRRRPPPR